MRNNALIRRLEEEMGNLAKAAMRPQERDAFEYGRVTGMYAGMERARDLLLEIEADQDRKDFDL